MMEILDGSNLIRYTDIKNDDDRIPTCARKLRQDKFDTEQTKIMILECIIICKERLKHNGNS